jgi:two-component system, chemotaxis family, chemotaxis protein CheY
MNNRSDTKVLVVDDEEIIIDLVTSLLTSIGCQVSGTARNGEEAVRLYQETSPDLVLLDFMMPGLSGLETLKQIRALDGRAEVVMLTAVDHNAVSDDCLLAGARDFVRKDLQAEDLLKRLTGLLDKVSG